MTWAERNGVAESWDAVLMVRAWFHAQGHTTYDAPPAPEGEPDNGDFYLGAPDGHRIEVKHRIGRNQDKFDFTTRSTYPYPDVLVCEAHQYDEKDPTPFMFWNVNTPMTAAYVNFTEASDEWVRRRRWDKFKNRYGWFYFAPMEVTKFVSLQVPLGTIIELDYPRSAWDTEEGTEG